MEKAYPTAFDAPIEKLCTRARRVVEIAHERVNAHRKPEKRDQYPYTPSVSDFVELMGLEIKRELLTVQLDLAEMYSDPLRFVLQHQLAQVEWQIAARDIT